MVIRIILKASLMCWVIVLSFGVFFALVPDSADRFTGPVVALVMGVGFAVYAAEKFYQVRREGFDIGWFFAEQSGLWVIFTAAAAVILLFLGVVWLAAPQRFELLLDKHAMPAAAGLVVLFWLSLISIFLSWALVCLSQTIGYARLRDLRWMAGSFLIGVMWIGFSAVFCSLFLDVINDVFVRMSLQTRRYILAGFALVATAAGLASGMVIDPKPLDAEDKKAGA